MEEPHDEQTSALVVIAQLRRQLADLMSVEEHTVLQPPVRAISFRGRLLGDPTSAFEEMSRRFARYGYVASIHNAPDGRHEVVAFEKVERKPPRVGVNVFLFTLTVASVLFIGAGYGLQDAGIEVKTITDSFWLPIHYWYLGIPFTATLLGILLAHELSHYFVAHRYGSPVSLPYFIPMPISIIGTMGAVITQQAPMRDRKALFDIGVAGPIGGLLVSIPLLVVGLKMSQVGPPPPGVTSAFQEGNSLLYAGLKYLVFGRFLPSHGEDVWLHSVAFAAWAGLLVTMVNLVPVGQLDGGHVSYALLGPKSKYLGFAAIGAMFAWGIWLSLTGNDAGSFWLLWAVINLSLNARHPPPLNDVSRLDGGRILFGLGVLVLFILIFMPAPLQEVTF